MLKQTPLRSVLYRCTHQWQLARVFFAVLAFAAIASRFVILTPVIFYTRAYARVCVRVRAGARTRGVNRRAVRRVVAGSAIAAALIVSVGLSLVAPKQAYAAGSNTLNFQARLQVSDGAIANDGDYNVQFKLYQGGTATSGGTNIWTETRLNSAGNGVHVVNGYLTVNLGDITPLPTNAAWDQDMFLTMNIGGTGSGAPSYDGEMSPRLKLTSVPYAFQAKQALTLQVSNGANTSTLSFVPPTTNRTILLPDASGNVCLENSNTCGFASSSGSSNYIQNGIGLQTAANFNIQSVSAGDVSAVIQAYSSQTADLLQFRDSAGNPTSGFNASGQLYYQSGSFTSTLVQDTLTFSNVRYHLPNRNFTDQELCTYEAGNCAGSGSGITGAGTTNYVARFNSGSTINASTLLYDNNSIIGVGATSGSGVLNVTSQNITQNGIYLTSAAGATASSFVVEASAAQTGALAEFRDDTGTPITIVASDGSLLTSASLTAGSLTSLSGNTGALTVQAAGSTSLGAVIRAGASQTGDLLQVQNSAGAAATGITSSGQLFFQSGSQRGLIVQDTLTHGIDVTYHLPDQNYANQTLCTFEAGNCAGSGSGITGAGTQNYVARFNTNSSINASSLLYDDGTFVGVGTGPTGVGLLSIQGQTPNQTSLYVKSADSATQPVAVIKGGLTPGVGADLLQLASSGGTVARFDSSGNFTTTGSASVGSGLTVTGGATITGATTINTTGTAATTIGTAGGNFSLLSTGLNVTTGGALSGITTLTESGLATFNGGLTIGAGQSFVNNSSTRFSSIAIATHATNSFIGTAASTVDISTTFDVTQTTDVILSLPVPTAGASGQIVYINSASTNSAFTMHGVRVSPGSSVGFIYNGSSWTAIGTGQNGVNSIGSINSVTKSADGAVISGSTLILQTADATNVGLVSTGSQTLAGDKTLLGALTVSNSADINVNSSTALQVRNGVATTFVVDTNGNRVGIGGAAANSVLTVGTNTTTAAGGITFGTDTDLFRSASASLNTSGSFGAGLTLQANSATANLTTVGATATGVAGAGVTFGSAGDTNIYRASANNLATDDSFALLGTSSNLTVQGTGTSSFAGSVTVGGNLTVSGTQFTNNGATLNTALTLGDFASSGPIGTAAATVDAHTTIIIAQTTINKTLSLPTPSATTAGRLIYVVNTGSADFVMHGVTVYAGQSQTYIWNGSAWVPTNIDTGGNGAASVGTIDAQPKSANGGVITANQLFLQSADASFPGLVTIGTQTFGGDKTFNGAITGVYGGTAGNGLTLTTSNTGTAGTNAVSGLNIALSGVANTTGSNVNTAINFPSVTAATGNTFNGLSFGTGYNNLITYNGTTVISGTGLINLAQVYGTLGVANGGTGATTLTSNGILFGNGTGAVQATSAAPNSVLITDGANAPSLSQTLPLAVQGNITSTGVLTSGSIAPGFGIINTNNAITTSTTLTGNVVNATGTGAALQLNGTNINVAGTLSNVAYLNQANTFSGGLTNTFSGAVIVQGSGGLTLGTAGTTTGTLVLANNTNSHTTSFQALSPASQDQTIVIPATNNPGGTDTVCLLTLANCGSAAAILGSGTQNFIAKFDTSGNHIGNSSLYDNGTFVGLNTQTNNGLLSIVGATSGQSSFFVQGAASATTAAVVIKGGATPATGGNLLELQDSTGAVLAMVDKTGVVYGASFDRTTAGALDIGATNATGINLKKNTAVTGTFSATGTTTLSSLGAGIVQSDAGGVLSSSAVDRNSGTLLSGTLTVANGGTGATTFTSNGLLYGNGTGALQAAAAGTAGQLLFTNVGGAPTFASASGDIASSATTIGALSISKLQGNTLTITTPTSGQYIRYNGSAFVNSALQAGDITGTLFTLAGSTGTSQNVTAGSTVSVLAGSSNNLTTTASATNTITVDIVSNPTFSGLVTSSANTTGLALTGTPAASATSSLAQFGSPIAGGNATANGGTYLGINLPASGAGSAADFVNLQSNGSSRYKITSAGTVTQAGNLTVSAGGITVTGNSSIAGNLTGLTGLSSSGTITFSGLGAGLVQSDASGVLSSGAVDRNSSTFFANNLSVANGGTGTNTFTSGGVLYGNAAGALQATAAGTSGQLLLADGSGVPIFATAGGDASITSAGAITVNKLQGNNLTISAPATGQFIRYNGTSFVNSAIQPTDIPDLGSIYIKNGTTQQTTANFNIQARVGTVAATIQGAAGQDIADFVTSGGTTAAKFDSIGNLTAVGGSFNGAVSIAAGSTFTNASSTLLTSLGIPNKTGGGPLGTSASTVDVATSFNVNQTTAGQNLTIPSPTDTTSGRIIYINNSGNTSFTLGSVTLAPGASITYIWNGTSWVALTSGSSTAGVSTLGTIDSQPKSADGAVIAGTNLYLQTADATNPGLVGTGTQTFAGAKTFNGAVTLAAAGQGLTVSNNAAIGGTLNVTGTTTLTSLGAGLVQSSSGGVLSSGAVDRNSTTFFNTALTVANGGTGATSFTTNGLLYGNGTGALQAATAGTAGQLLFANTSGVPTFASASGDIASSATTIGALSISKLQGNTLTLTSPTSGQYIRYNGSAFVNSALQAGDISGTLFTLAGTSGTSQNVTAGSTVSVLAGSSNNLTTVAGATNTITVDIVSNPTFSGKVTSTANTTGLAVTGTPAASATSSLAQFGNALVGGNAAANGGTYIGINLPASGAGSAADFINLQSNGVSKYSITSAGVVTQAGSLTVSSGGITVTGNSSIAGNLTGLTSLSSSGTITFSGLGAGLVQSDASGVLSSGAVDRNSATFFNTALTVANGGTGATSFTSNGLLYGNGTGALQAAAAGTAGQLLFANASGVPTFTTLAGDLTSSASTIGSVSVSKLQGNTLTITTPTSGQYIRYNGSAFVNSALQAGDIFGTLFTLAGTSGTSQNVTAGSTVSVLAGSSNNLTTVAGATNTITVDIVSNPTFTGKVTSSANTTGLALTGTPAASATSSLAQLGAAIAGGNAVANGGTYLGINLPASGAGSAADFINLQSNGVSKYSITSAGVVTQAGSLTVSSGGITVTGNSSITGNLTGLTGLSSSGTITFSGLGAGLVQSSAGGVLSSGAVDRNSSTFFNTALSVANGGTGATSFTTNGLLYGNNTGAIQATTAGTAGQIAFAGTGGVPGFATLGGDLTASTSTIGSVSVSKLQGNTLTLTSPTSGQYIRYNGSAFVNSALQAGDITGTLFTLAGSTGTSQNVTAGSTVSVLAGGSNNLTAVASATNTLTVDIISNPTFTGKVTSSSNTTGLALTGTPAASATSSLLQLGAAIVGGNATAGTGGTYIGVNLPASGAGSTADFLNFQNNGTSKLQVTSSGALTVAGVTTLSNLNAVGIVHNSAAGVLSTGLVVLGTDTSGTYVGALGAVDGVGSPNANGGTISSNTLYLSSANASFPGVVNTGAQTFAGLKTFNGGINIINGATFTNAGASVFTAVAIGDTTTDTTIGASAAATVDAATSFNVTQTTSGRNLTLFSPTTATAGRIVYINNTSTNSTSFTMYGAVIKPGEGQSFMWTGSNWRILGNANAGTGLTQTGTTINSAAPTSVGALNGGTANATGATIASNVLYLQSASTSFAGLVDTTTQSFVGAKTFTSQANFTAATGNALQAGSGNQFQIDNGGNVVSTANGQFNGTLKVGSSQQFQVSASGVVKYASSATSDTGTVVCRNSLGELAACTTTFAPGVATDYIQNRYATQQTNANFNIQGTAGQVAAKIQGVTGSDTLQLFGSASNSTPTVTFGNTGDIATTGNLAVNSATPIISTTSTGTASVFNTNATTLNIGGAATALNIGAAGATLTGGGALTIAAGGTNQNLTLKSSGTGILQLRPGSDSTTGVQIQTAGGTSIFDVNTTNQTVGIGAGGATDARLLSSASGSLVGLRVNTTGSGNLLELQNGGTNVLNVDSAGNFNQNGTGLTFQTSTGAVSLKGDTTVSAGKFFSALGRTINTDADQTVGSALFATSLTKNDSNTRTFYGVNIQPTINTGASNTNTTFNALNVDTVNTATTGVTTNLLRLAYGGSQKLTVANDGSLVSTGGLQGTLVNATSGFQVNGLAAAGQYLRGDGTKFVSSSLLGTDISGTIFKINGDTGGAINFAAGSTLNVIQKSGGTGNINTTSSSNTISIDITPTPSFQKVTLTNSGGIALQVDSDPTPGATLSLFKIGSGAIAGGNSTASTGGTYLGINEPAAGGGAAGSTADFINFQNGGTTEFKVTSTGTVTTNNTLTVNSGGATISNGGLTVSNGGATITNGGLTVSNSGGASISGDVSITGTSKLTVGTGQIQFGSLTAGGLGGIVTSGTTGILSSGTLSRNSSYLTSTLTIANGGTGATSYNTNGVLYSDGTAALQSTSSFNNGVFISSAAGVPSFQNTLPTQVQGNITSLNASTGVSAGKIVSGFGTITTGNNISTTATVQGGTVDATNAFTIGGVVGTAGKYLRNNGTTGFVASNLNTSDLTGTLFTLAGSTGTSELISNTNNTVSILAANAGTTGNLTSVVSSPGTITLDIKSAPTFTGKITSSANTTGLALTGTPTAIGSSALFMLQAAGVTPVFSGSSNGTYIGINEAAADNSDFLNFQKSGSSVLKVSTAGLLNAYGGFAVNTKTGITTTCSGGGLLTSAEYTGGIVTSGTCSVSSDLVTLQIAYNNSGAGNQIVLNNTNGGLKVTDNATDNATTGTNNLFQVTNGAGTTVYLGVNKTQVTITDNLKVAGGYDQGTNTTANAFNGDTTFKSSGTAVYIPNGTLYVGNNAAIPLNTFQATAGQTVTTFTNSVTSSANSVTISNSNVGTAARTITGVNLSLGASANSNGNSTTPTNIVTGLSFSAPNTGAIADPTNDYNPTGGSIPQGARFNGLSFSGTGFYDLINLNGTRIIDGGGQIQNAAFSPTVNYSNINKVGNLISGSIVSGFGSISTTNLIQTTGALKGDTLGIGGASFNKLTVTNSGDVTALGGLTVASGGQFIVNGGTGNLTTSATIALTNTGAGNEFTISGTPAVSATSSLLQFSADAIAGGNNTATVGGTYIGINQKSAASGLAGSGADFVNFQNGGVSQFRITSTGTTSVNGSLTVANAGSANPALSVTGVINASSAYKVGGSVGTAGQFLRSDGTTGFVAGGLQASDGAGVFIQKVPSSTANNTIAPTASGVVALTVQGTTAGGSNVLEIFNSNATPTRQAFFDANGSLNVNQPIQTVGDNAVDIGATGNRFRTGYFGTSLTTPMVTTLTQAAANGVTLSIQPGASSFNGGTGGNVNITGGNETGTTSTGGSVTVDGGTGTSTNGSVTIGGTNSRVINIGNANTATVATFSAGNYGLKITNTGIGINTGAVTPAVDLAFGGTADRTISIQAQVTSNTVGNILNVQAGAGNGTGNGGSLVLQGGAKGASGTAAGAVIVRSNGTNGTAFQVQASDTSVLFDVNTSTKVLKIGTGTQNFTAAGAGDLYVSGITGVSGLFLAGTVSDGASFDGTTHELLLAGTARHTKIDQLTPEYPGAVLTPADTTATHTGTMTSDFCSNTAAISVNTTNDCTASGQVHNYYSWTSATTGNNYNIYTRYKLPSDFSAFDSTTGGFFIDLGLQSNADSAVVRVFKTNAGGTTTQCASSTIAGTGTWATTQINGSTLVTGCTSFAADDTLTIEIKLVVGSPNHILRAGEIKFKYYSKY